MLLGLHSYSFHLHGMGQNWGGHQLGWPRTMDIFQLIDEAVTMGLNGLHITAADCESTEEGRLEKIRTAAEKRGLYLEYNFSLDEKYDPRLTNTFEEGIAIAQKLGADVAKVSLDLRRPRPLAASRHHPEVVRQLEDIARKLHVAAPMAEAAGVKLALENHTESFSSEVLWLIDRVNHPSVGACVDTVNALLVTEDPMVDIENLTPRALTNHFKDHRIETESYGCRITGVALGDGDVDLKRAYEIIRQKSSMKRINIEVELDAGTDGPVEACRREREAVERSIRYCREVLRI